MDNSDTPQTANDIMLTEAEIRAALQESHDRFHTLFATIPLGVVYQTADGAIEKVNQAACDILGLTYDQMMGLTSMDPRWRAEDEEGNELPGDQHPAMRALSTGKPVENVVLSVFSPRHENRRWLLVNAVPEFRDGEDKPFRAYAAFADITDRRETSEALAASESRFRSVINSAPLGVHLWSLNDEGKLIFTGANEAADRILGMDNAKLFGMELLEAFPANAETGLLEKYVKICNGGEPWKTEHYIYDDDVITGAFEVNAFQTSPGNMAAFFADITERKQAEIEREKLIGDLKNKQQELENFTYAVSHDLKSPMITIQGFLGMAERSINSGDTQRLRTDLARIGSASEKMFQILNDLLEFSRVGRTETTHEKVVISELVQEVLELLDGPLQQNNVEVVVGSDLPTLTTDHSRLHSVFQNLIENAIKFSRPDAKPRIEIDADAAGKELVFSVKDNGIGIDPRYQDDIFNLFSKLDSSKPGSGMGLALVKRIVESLGGKIWVESKGTRTGTCFSFSLPHRGS